MRRSFQYFIVFLFLLTLSVSNAEQFSDIDFDLYTAESFPNSDLDLYLLSTITGSTAKAILKNPINERVGSYVAGQYIDVIPDKRVKVVKVFPCMGIIEKEGKLQKINCKSSEIKNDYFKPHMLFGFRIVDPNQLFLSDDFNTEYDKYILDASEKHEVDPNLVKAIIKAESNFDHKAVSPKNARGLMQLIPATAKSYGVSDSFNPSSNIEAGVKMLKELINHYKGDIKLALAAYNAGKGAVKRYRNSIPPYPETREYIKKVLVYYDSLKSTSEK